ncbi:MAG: hypothetical protein KDK70_40960 [Myxococcales bacterium]|nr:hypothetical protein [Myxococcales bacterium]
MANTPKRCARLDRVAEAWAQLVTVPSTPTSRSIARNLEKCRRRLLYSISRRHRDEATAARDAFYDGLVRRLRKAEGTLFWAAISGGSHERLRIGAAQLDEARAERIMSAGLRADLERLSFAHVVFSDGKHTKVYEFEVTPDGELGLPDLRAVGLGEPLEIPR